MKVLLALMMVMTCLTASAQSRRGEGRIDLRNGDSTVRISIGNDRDNSYLLTRRVRLLEEAVRDLQDQVYDLRENERPRERSERVVVCSLKTSFRGTYIGKASTRLEAEALARNNCQRAGAPFCSSEEVKCEARDVIVAGY
jgi:hypothetical protein